MGRNSERRTRWFAGSISPAPDRPTAEPKALKHAGCSSAASGTLDRAGDRVPPLGDLGRAVAQPGRATPELRGCPLLLTHPRVPGRFAQVHLTANYRRLRPTSSCGVDLQYLVAPHCAHEIGLARCREHHAGGTDRGWWTACSDRAINGIDALGLG